MPKKLWQYSISTASQTFYGINLIYLLRNTLPFLVRTAKKATQKTVRLLYCLGNIYTIF